MDIIRHRIFDIYLEVPLVEWNWLARSGTFQLDIMSFEAEVFGRTLEGGYFRSS